MANTVIALKKSATPSAVPSTLANGELAINYADGKLFYKDIHGGIKSFNSDLPPAADSFGSVSANGTLIVADTNGDVLNIVPGNNIQITGNTLTDTITISAISNVTTADVTAVYNHANAAFDKANAAYNAANAIVTISSTAPASPNISNLWWNTNTGGMYIYYNDGNSSQWVEVGSANGNENPLEPHVRTTVSFATNSLAAGASQNMNVAAFKTFTLMKIESTQAAWVRLYSDPEARTADETRSIETDATAGSGLLAEFVLTANVSQRVTPFVICGNLEEVPTSNVYVRVTNLSGITTAINTDITVMGLET